MLSDKQHAFVIQYCVDFNGTQAAIRAGYSENGAAQQASELLTYDKIKKAVEERQKDLAAAAAVTPEWILRQWVQLATADPNELSHIKIVNCRHCWGYGGAYQWTQNEYLEAMDKAITIGKPAPECKGGMDFDPNGEANPECQECGGDGVEILRNADTRKVKGNARGLFAGVKQGKFGIEVKTRDQDAALKNLAAYLGMSIDRKEISGPGGKPIPLATVTASDLTDEQLVAMLAPNVDEK